MLSMAGVVWIIDTYENRLVIKHEFNPSDVKATFAATQGRKHF